MIFQRLFNLTAWLALLVGLCLLLHLGMGWQERARVRPESLLTGAKSGDLGLVRRILASPVCKDADIRDASGHTALMWAARYRHVETARALLEAGADPNARSPGGETPLSQAALGGEAAMIRLLLEHRADQGLGDALFWSAAQGDLTVLTQLLDQGTSPDRPNALGATALMGASEFGQTEAVRFLIRRNADLNARDRAGRTALSIAATNGQAQIVRILLKGGASPVLRDQHGMTAIHRARERRHWEIVRILDGRGSG